MLLCLKTLAEEEEVVLVADQRGEESQLYSELKLLEDEEEAVLVISGEVVAAEAEVQVVLQEAEEAVVEGLEDDNMLRFLLFDSCGPRI